MKTVAFYFSQSPGPGRTPIVVWDKASVNGTVVYIRAEVFDTADLDEALRRALPQPGESVMNTHLV